MKQKAPASTVFGLASIFANSDRACALTIPTEKAVPPWDELLRSFNLLELRGDFRPRNIEEAKFLLLTCAEPWLIKLHLLYKNSFDANHKIPASRAVAKHYSFDVEVLLCLREICKELHARKGIETGYSDAGKWFFFVVADQILLDAQLGLERFRQTGRVLANAGHLDIPELKPGLPINKKAYIKMKREHWLKALKAGTSPFDAEPPGFCPHWAGLIKMALSEVDPDLTFIEKGNVFCQKYWKPYLRAESKLLTEKDKNPLVTQYWYENGKIYQQDGKGRREKVAVKIS